ncbi:hypothetical protein LTR29_005689 [Friedmanniomyces endolithicus]|nr:hypothetical protein LTR29_005689 [Friedmanniomyces endolithicus]
MALWDTYFAPGDLRRRNQIEAHAALSTAQHASTSDNNDRLNGPPQRISAAYRQRRQDVLLYGGLLFTFLSLLITRRSLQRKKIPFPETFQTSNAPPPKTEGALDAAEALGLATLNTCSIAMLAAGVGMKWFDIADVEDLRDVVRKGVGFDVYGGDSQADREVEGWIADVLSRKDGEGGLKESIASKLKELEELDRKKGVNR